MTENEFWVFPFVALAEIGDAALSRPNAATSTIAFVLVAAGSNLSWWESSTSCRQVADL